ncbi:MAG: TetR/AcrR family transcriptional regulator [Caldilineaceae bacterium]|nr:TetR/AcrR family transcriptional regulator [Caldilineaceae bacterium]
MASNTTEPMNANDQDEISEAKERVLDAAEILFMRQGYTAITLRDIARELNMKQASLYYHFPKGKEQLYMEMSQRFFLRNRRGLDEAIATAAPTVSAQLYAVAEWFAGQPLVSLASMMRTDMPALQPETADHLSRMAYDALFVPLRTIFIDGAARGETRPVNPDVLAGSFLAIMDGIQFGRKSPHRPSRAQMLDEIISVLLDGLRDRTQPTGPPGISRSPSA